MYGILALLSLVAMFGQDVASFDETIATVRPIPPLPFVDWKACPFEGCTYRPWTARKSVPVYDTWKAGRMQIQQLSAGEKVTAITGLVATYQPGLIRMDRDLPEQELKRGDTILTYSYRGEGYSGVWFGGKYRPCFDISFAKRPDGSGCGGAHCAATYVSLGIKVWWAQVKLASGRLGWVREPGPDFDGCDLLA
jgi:hypothetical protein